ncbi:MAG: hypothetical protein FJ395_14480 [Verrucomicrobia bacterium]|nr:hypothetical protein [Verrucomicrobiota bacterium]
MERRELTFRVFVSSTFSDLVAEFFVCHRYGWGHEPRHFCDTADRQRQEQEPCSITDLEVRHAVLKTIRVESEESVQPPVNIGHIQWLDIYPTAGKNA